MEQLLSYNIIYVELRNYIREDVGLTKYLCLTQVSVIRVPHFLQIQIKRIDRRNDNNETYM